MEETRQPSGKRPKLLDGEQNMASIDRLSNLPDVVLCHILSFLRTKLSVATSVLGKRWRFLWTHVPCLDFNWDDFRKRTKTSDIIHRVILRHKANRMNTLKLDCIQCNEYQLETLITTAIDRGIRNLYLERNLDTSLQYLFNCKTIVDLKLDINRVSFFHVDNVSLPSLKKFHVFYVVCENDEALSHFLSGCPSLEELDMGFTYVEENDYVGCINISSPTIKTLKLDLDDLTCCPSDLKYRMMIINAPTLRYLQVYGCDLECIIVPKTMVSLVEADIYLHSYNSKLVKFLHSLCYVKCLTISGWEFEEFVHGGVAFSDVKFDNLIKLELQLDFKWSLLVKFLEVADNLEVLICQQDYHERGYLCPEPEQVPKCLLSRLRTITISGMQSEEHEFDMVKYLLKNSRVLERMKLFYVRIDLKTKFQALKRISLFERGSDVCQLDFLPDC
ncbi:F-box/FBD/LRR-repeat protein [Striga hermonthica]|uniref:F-box/FBD/LRR-repeat protein n=1 Tax=Striga hermonthica TaxID=68872 RepID=A0A9N7MJS8_STRHE|nr:F-box/FBD/LRR-repeat protein [Striga hermonthica]